MQNENKPEYTNTDIMVKLNEIGTRQAEQGKALGGLANRVRSLEDWQIAFKAAEEALAKVDAARRNKENPSSAYAAINKDLLNIIGKIIGAVSGVVALLYVIATRS